MGADAIFAQTICGGVWALSLGEKGENFYHGEAV